MTLKKNDFESKKKEKRERLAFIQNFPLLKSLTIFFSILHNKKVFQSKSPMSSFIQSEGPSSTRIARVTLIAVDHQDHTLLDSCPDSPSLETEEMPTKETKIWKENILIPLSVAVCYRLRQLLTSLTTSIHQDPAGRFRLTLEPAQSWPGDVHSGTIRGWEIEYVVRTGGLDRGPGVRYLTDVLTWLLRYSSSWGTFHGRGVLEGKNNYVDIDNLTSDILWDY